MQASRAKPLSLIAAGLIVIACNSTWSATQGSLGATSTGTITIQASTAYSAQISGLVDVTFTNVDAESNANSSQNDCVYSNSSTQGYTVKASGDGTANAFTLASTPATTAIPYSVSWAGTSGAPSGTALTAGTTSSGFTTNATSPTCSSAPTSTSTLFVTISSANLQLMVPHTTYTGVLTLLITPQ